jgi:hypothetical protein
MQGTRNASLSSPAVRHDAVDDYAHHHPFDLPPLDDEAHAHGGGRTAAVAPAAALQSTTNTSVSASAPSVAAGPGGVVSGVSAEVLARRLRKAMNNTTLALRRDLASDQLPPPLPLITSGKREFISRLPRTYVRLMCALLGGAPISASTDVPSHTLTYT